MYLHFYKCNVCGQTVAIVKGTGVPMECCNDEMELLLPNDTEGLEEKHVPVYEEIKECCNKVIVKTGITPHPSERNHFIDWIALETNKGVYFRNLKPGDKPEATFTICSDERVVDVYSYCNIHGLWKSPSKNKF